MTDLSTLGGRDSAAYAVSGTGAVAGVSDTGDGDARHGFLYANSQMRDLAPLPGADSSAAYAVSRTSQVVGASQTAAGMKRATLWRNGNPTDLNALLPPHSGWVLTEARAVNDHGQIAGQGFWNGKPCAFLLTPR
jgi:probable HAF family extracellular repeat protein